MYADRSIVPFFSHFSMYVFKHEIILHVFKSALEYKRKDP